MSSGGDAQGLIHPDAFVQDSTSYYFEALLKAGSEFASGLRAVS